MDYCTIYFSKSETLSQEIDLLTMLQQSRRDNAEVGITGVLLYVRGSIVQVLEGEQQAVESLFQRIKQDQRHTDVTRVLDRFITNRLFAQWTMGYETITGSQLADMKTLINLKSNDTLSSHPGPNGILNMIRAFYDGNRYN